MSWCDADDCARPDDWIGTPVHTFSGYGYYLVFHPECCPRAYDGLDCDDEHPVPRGHLAEAHDLIEYSRASVRELLVLERVEGSDPEWRWKAKQKAREPVLRRAAYYLLLADWTLRGKPPTDFL